MYLHTMLKIGDQVVSPELKECEAQVLKLSASERALLAEHLIASLDSVDDVENEQLWIEEAERRYQQYRTGCISARPATDVLRDARAAIR